MISDAIRKMNQKLSAEESVSSLEFSGEFGNTMARYDKTSDWHMIATPTEIAREREFNYIFNNAEETKKFDEFMRIYESAEKSERLKQQSGLGSVTPLTNSLNMRV